MTDTARHDSRFIGFCVRVVCVGKGNTMTSGSKIKCFVVFFWLLLCFVDDYSVQCNCTMRAGEGADVS